MVDDGCKVRLEGPDDMHLYIPVRDKKGHHKVKIGMAKQPGLDPPRPPHPPRLRDDRDRQGADPHERRDHSDPREVQGACCSCCSIAGPRLRSDPGIESLATLSLSTEASYDMNVNKGRQQHQRSARLQEAAMSVTGIDSRSGTMSTRTNKSTAIHRSSWRHIESNEVRRGNHQHTKL